MTSLYVEPILTKMPMRYASAMAPFLTGFNPNSWQQVARVLYEDMGLPLQHSKDQRPEEKPKGSTDVFALDSLRSISDSSFIPAMLDWRKYTKLYGTYVNGLEQEISPDRRIHPDYNIAGSETGRLTGCEDHDDPQARR